MATVRDEFRNESGGFIGVITINARGDRQGIAVAHGDTVWLSEEEQIETANAPRADADNPLTNGALVLVTEAAEVKNRRALRPEQPLIADPVSAFGGPGEHEDGVLAPIEPPVEEETGAAPEPEAEPEQGAYQPGEEVGTPEAAIAPAPARRRKPAAVKA